MQKLTGGLALPGGHETAVLIRRLGSRSRRPQRRAGARYAREKARLHCGRRRADTRATVAAKETARWKCKASAASPPRVSSSGKRLNDPETLKQCIPGCESIDKVSDTEFTAKVRAKVGPVIGAL